MSTIVDMFIFIPFYFLNSVRKQTKFESMVANVDR